MKFKQFITEAKTYSYQVKIDSSRWHDDVKFESPDLKTLAMEIDPDYAFPKKHDHKTNDAAELNAMVATHLPRTRNGTGNTVDEDYSVLSLKDDVLVIEYHVTSDDDRTIKKKGEIRIMPAV